MDVVVQVSPATDILSWVLVVAHRVGNEGVAIFFMNLWAIWLSGNMLVFEGIRRGAREIVDMAGRLLTDYTTALQDFKPTIDSMQIKWHPPPLGSFKANVDGALFLESRSAGIGVIVRDSAGRVIATTAKHIVGDFPANVVEALGVHFAVQFVRDLGLQSIMVGGDNLEVINAINSKEIDLTALGLILDDVQDTTIEHYGTITFGHTRRERNKVAHGLARNAQNVEGSMVFGSCDGLLCIVFDMNTAVLWNPSTREYKRLPVPCSSGRKSSLFGYGFGYDSSIDDYKVVRICPSARQGVPMGAELYTLKTNSWKKIEGITFDVLFMDRLDRGSFANGAMYWWVIAFTFSKDEYDSSSKILRFDLKAEKFKLLPPPRHIPKNLLMNLGVIAGFLCTGRDNHGSGIKLWRLKDDGVKQMWSKGVAIGVNRCVLPICYPICYPKMGEVLMHIIRKGQDNIVLCLCNLDDTTLKTQLIHVPEFWSDATTYVESLVSPNQCWEEKVHLEL
ncbi:hypothetical protein L1049_016456 [Liquidambar formosana]|uniref:RNase H type-1 domain-containing protein n=1 Tax=Liquidambar formosana TaxID=63359 RepID=A0AAP0X344_LIQFO